MLYFKIFFTMVHECQQELNWSGVYRAITVKEPNAEWLVT